MGRCLKKNVSLLHALAKCSPSLRKCILSHGDHGLTDSISEICYNCLRGVPTLKPTQKRRLKRHSQDIEFMGNPNIPRSRKRRFLKQKGGFIGTLLTTLLPTVVSLAGSALGRLFGSSSSSSKSSPPSDNA